MMRTSPTPSSPTMYARFGSVIAFDDLPDPGDTLELVRKLGEGTYGSVYQALNRLSGESVAVKVLESVHEVIEEIEEEYLILRDLGSHANLPSFYGIYMQRSQKSPDQLWIAMELCDGGSVADLVKTRLTNTDQPLPELVLAHIIAETMKALEHLHKNRVMHRDVKGQNIMLTSSGEVKLVDFGVSGHLKSSLSRRHTSVGTPFWMAPEVIACESQREYDYDVRCDVWSLGVTAIELAEGEPPLADLHPMSALFKIPRNPPPMLSKPDDWTTLFVDFITKCLVKDFTCRPFVSELFQHSFIAQVECLSTQLQATLVQLMTEAHILEAGTPSVDHTSDSTVHGSNMASSHAETSRDTQPVVDLTDDLASLEKLDEETMISCLCNRYACNRVYTYVGNILLAINPFTPLGIYDDQYRQLYKNACKAGSLPHIFAIADYSYQQMVLCQQNQCIVISGESGSGKTESANFLVQQLTFLGHSPNRKLEQQILQVNPLLEAFGNAQTVINKNSSRFGKYLEMTFSATGKAAGAQLSEYLLEKSRVVCHASGEGNFHMLHYVHYGLDGVDGFHLKADHQYRYLSPASSDDLDDAAVSRDRFASVGRCFEVIGFRPQDVSAIHRVLAAILHLGEVDLAEMESDHRDTVSYVTDTELLDIVSSLLAVDTRELLEALTTSGIMARGETIVKRNNLQEAIGVRDAMAKALYGRLFSWIVNRINKLLKPTTEESSDSEHECCTIGILDIFGFENFAVNSYEQLCINVANEQMQVYFNQHVFMMEQEEYRREGIDATDVEFTDNRSILDLLLAKPVGLLALLDEESNFPKATDTSLVQKFQNNVTSAQFSMSRSHPLVFTIEHYAGKVEYDASGFLEKNQDRLAAEVVSMLRTSRLDLVRSLFNSPITKIGGLAYSTISARSATPPGSGLTVRHTAILSGSNSSSTQARTQQTVATYFRLSLQDLLSKLNNSQPQFVRCIRPNADNRPGFFNAAKVSIQLRYTGVLETVRIRLLGFSYRVLFADFIRRFSHLTFTRPVSVSSDLCETILKRLGFQDYAIGQTKVFLKYHHEERLLALLEHHRRRVILVQSVVRRWLCCRRVMKLRDELNRRATKVQAEVRGFLVRRHLHDERRLHAAVIIQSSIRGFLQRAIYKSLVQEYHRKMNILSTAASGFLCGHNRLSLITDPRARLQAAAITLQKYFRMWMAQARLIHMQLDSIGGSSANSDARRIIFPESEAEVEQMTVRPVLLPSLLPSIGDDRQEMLQKTFERKLPWTDMETQYYDAVNREKKVIDEAIRRKQKMMTGDGLGLASNISDDASRCYGDGSSSGVGEQLQVELMYRLELQQKTSSLTQYQELVAENDSMDDMRKNHSAQNNLLRLPIHGGVSVLPTNPGSRRSSTSLQVPLPTPNGKLISNSESGVFDFRSILRKTNFYETNDETLSNGVKQSDTEDSKHDVGSSGAVKQIDFRSVLRRKAIS